MNYANNIPQIKNLEGIVTLISELEEGMKFTKHITTIKHSKGYEGAVYSIDTKDLSCLTEFIEHANKYALVVEYLEQINKFTEQLKENLDTSLQYTSKLAGDINQIITAQSQNDSKQKKGILDILDSTQEWMQSTLTEEVNELNQALEEINPLKPKSELRKELIRLNSSLKECYASTNMIQIYGAANNIICSSKILLNKLIEPLRCTRYSDYNRVAKNSAESMQKLVEVSKGKKRIEFKISSEYSININIMRQVSESDDNMREKRILYKPWKKKLVPIKKKK
ncbi:hypothetical protein HOK51_07470 [Candidatus Woesearchaeota archaeon]|jgi:hypothetical protein|nr:hypothetical protein [Candidatus Woesearchaeota archaeon]MBT6519662.1 hypothetical protein [Candidatus Woesearchaeota archaeon]MBT7368692.1 hypothetical protein [Candidatus Woesearchaeota archaeon]